MISPRERSRPDDERSAVDTRRSEAVYTSVFVGFAKLEEGGRPHFAVEAIKAKKAEPRQKPKSSEANPGECAVPAEPAGYVNRVRLGRLCERHVPVDVIQPARQ